MTSRTMGWVFAALLVLAAVSFGVSFAPLGAASMPVAMLIAGVKAALVTLYFMELIEQRFSAWIVVATGAAWAVLLVTLVTADILTRGPATVPPVTHVPSAMLQGQPLGGMQAD